MVMHALVLAAMASSGPVTPSTAAGPATIASPEAPTRRPRAPKEPWSWRFVGAHYGTGVMASLLVLPGSYAAAGWIGHRGRGLGPVIGALLFGAFVPPALTYTAQWAVGRAIAPRRDRFWPGHLVNQLGHLAIFAGAVLGGADFRVFRDVAPVVLTDALVVTGLGTLTAEATRPPLTPMATPELSWQRHQRLWGRSGMQIVVPVLEIALP